MSKSNNQTTDVALPAENYLSDEISDNHETNRGYLTGPGLHEFPVDYVVIDNYAFYGCIELGPVEQVKAEAERIQARLFNQANALESKDLIAQQEPQQPLELKGIGLPTNSSYLWPKGVVPYTIQKDLPDTKRVTDAIKHIQDLTAIQFVRRTSANANRYPNYIEIISNGNRGWSSSSIGMRGGKQFVRYSNRHSWPILVHEFLHALGVYHEQSRSDRDKYVEIKWNNIQENRVGNFQKQPSSQDYHDYDYGSIMHYPGTSFAKDRSKPTIVPLKRGVTIGQRNGLSAGDRQTIAKMYERFFTKGYSGVWRAGSGRYAIWINASWNSFKAKWQEWNKQGLRLQDIHVHRVNGKTLYSGLFRPGSGAYGLWANVSWSSFKAKWQEWNKKGLRLVDLHVHRVGGENRYSGVFLPSSGSYGLWVNVSWDSFKAKWQEWNKKGLRLVDIHVHKVGDKTRYSGVFLPGSGSYGLWANASWSSFLAKWREWNEQGLRLVDLNVHRVGNQNRYSGVFLPGRDNYYLWANVTYEGLRAKWQELAGKGLRLVDFEILNTGDVGAADVADSGLDEQQDEMLSPHEMEAFGGIFGDDTLSDISDFSETLLEKEPAAVQDLPHPMAEVDVSGGAFFPEPEEGVSLQDESFGGAFFVDEPTDTAAVDENGGGEAVFDAADAADVAIASPSAMDGDGGMVLIN